MIPDGGIDVVLDGPVSQTIGIQVKRSKSKIKAEAIRSLTGALVINGHTRGMFITTSSFQHGAIETARRSEEKGYPIELMDADKFYDALKIAQRSQSFSKKDKKAPYCSILLHCYSHQHYDPIQTCLTVVAYHCLPASEAENLIQ